MPDMDGHRALRAIGGLVPHLLVNLGGGVDPARMAHEQQQDIVLNRRQVHSLPVQSHGFRLVVHGDGADGQLVGLLLHAAQGGIPAQLGAHTCQHLDGVEWLGDVVVCADVQSQDLVGVLALGGEEDDGNIVLLPELGGGGDAVHLRHHDVHQDKMDGVLAYNLQGLPSGKSLVEAVALGGEVYF